MIFGRNKDKVDGDTVAREEAPARQKKVEKRKTFPSLTTGLRSVLYRAPKYDASDQDAAVIAVCSQKGGVGKTTTSTSIGYELAETHKKRTLIIDLDPQGHVETSLTTIIRPGQRYRSMSKLLRDRHPDISSGLVSTDSDFLHLTPGDKQLADASIWLDHYRARKEFILRDLLQPILPYYDYILLDCPPYMGNMMLNGLVAARFCLIPSDMSILSLEGVSDMLNGLQVVKRRVNSDLALLGILLTRVDEDNVDLNRLIRGRFEEHAQGYLFDARIPYDHALSRAQYAGNPVAVYEPGAAGSKAYKAVVEELVSRVEAALRQKATGGNARKP
ncbi:MAG: hypothetical protein DSZ32_05025 [Gammaproteobacteria bacterium]|nr:MAG: hypothetical protein DSZ32_05025 [Gammaproteobacteria bacterium]